MKLRKLLDYPEPLGDFMAFVPGTRRQQNYPSTVAYLAQLIIHRYAMLGVLDEKGFPTREMGMLEAPRDENEPKLMQGALATAMAWSAQCVPNTPASTLLAEVSALHQIPKVRLQRIAAGTGELDDIADRDASMLSSKFHNLQ